MEQDNYSISWKDLPWEKFQKKSFRLQCKIYEAKQTGNCKGVERLQKLLVFSKSAHYLASRHILNLFSSRQTKDCATFSSEHLSKIIKSLPNLLYKKEIGFKIMSRESRFISSEDTLGINIVNYLCTMISEPVSQAILFDHEGRFDLGPHIWDVQRRISVSLGTLARVVDRKVLEINIPRISLCFYLSTLTPAIGAGLSLLVRYCSYKTYTFEGSSHRFSTTQGSVLQMFLKNLFLRGLVGLDNELERSLSQAYQCLKSNFMHRDSLLCISRKDVDICMLIDKINDFLGIRGITLEYEHLKILSFKAGFDFLMWHFMIKSSRECITSPSFIHWGIYKRVTKSALDNPTNSILSRIENSVWISKKWHALHRFSNSCLTKSRLYYLKLWFSRNLLRSTNIPQGNIDLYVAMVLGVR